MFHTTIVSVQLRQISLPSDIQNSLQSVLNEDLLQEAELKKRTNTLAEFDRARPSAAAGRPREVVQIEEVVRSISVERATRKDHWRISLCSAQQTVNAETRRRTKATRSRLLQPRNSRQGKLQNVLNEEEKTKIRNQDKEAIAIADMIVVTNAKADADRIINDGGVTRLPSSLKRKANQIFSDTAVICEHVKQCNLRHNHFDSIVRASATQISIWTTRRSHFHRGAWKHRGDQANSELRKKTVIHSFST